MAERATKTDLIDLTDYIKDLGITKKSAQIVIREALVKAYKSTHQKVCLFDFLFLIFDF